MEEKGETSSRLAVTLLLFAALFAPGIGVPVAVSFPAAGPAAAFAEADSNSTLQADATVTLNQTVTETANRTVYQYYPVAITQTVTIFVARTDTSVGYVTATETRTSTVTEASAVNYFNTLVKYSTVTVKANQTAQNPATRTATQNLTVTVTEPNQSLQIATVTVETYVYSTLTPPGAGNLTVTRMVTMTKMVAVNVTPDYSGYINLGIVLAIFGVSFYWFYRRKIKEW